MKANNRIEDLVIRFDEMQPCKTAFIDSKTPGSERKENFCLIGKGVSENSNQFVHITTPHGFNVGGARQPVGCKNSHHSHDTSEVFMVHSGTWQFTWGDHGEDGQTTLIAGDVISIPTHLLRGFENVGEEDDAFMFSILGLDENGSAGHVLWAPYVFEAAKDHGLVLLKDGRLLNPSAGDIIPCDAALMPSTTPEDLDGLKKISLSQMLECTSPANKVDELTTGGITCDGVIEYAVIGPENEYEKFGAGKMNWSHGFHLRRIHIEPNKNIQPYIRQEEEVIIVHKGSTQITAFGERETLSAGDLITIPTNTEREIRNVGDQTLELFVVRGGDKPSPAKFTSKQN